MVRCFLAPKGSSMVSGECNGAEFEMTDSVSKHRIGYPVEGSEERRMGDTDARYQD